MQSLLNDDEDDDDIGTWSDLILLGIAGCMSMHSENSTFLRSSGNFAMILCDHHEPPHTTQADQYNV